MKIFKKNQMIITALALMIAAAGYVIHMEMRVIWPQQRVRM